MTPTETTDIKMPAPKAGRDQKAPRSISIKIHKNSKKRSAAPRKTLMQRLMGDRAFSDGELVAKVRHGLNYSAISTLSSFLEVSQKDMARILLITPSTLVRRKQEGRLHVDESDRVARLARLMDAAVEMMDGDIEAATRWLNTPVDLLDGESPLDRAGTEIGAREVEKLITRIQHGVFS